MQPPSCTKHQPQIRTLFPHASPVFNLSFCRDVVSWAFRKLNTLPCVDLRIIIFRRKKENGLKLRFISNSPYFRSGDIFIAGKIPPQQHCLILEHQDYNHGEYQQQ
mmetsp:Transcript_6131/g.13333  ORF Transcript_6131/g.13333 Transcript_6131/m.13333 type:complete len:106 (+) Transcript_6131:510-827(+)